MTWGEVKAVAEKMGAKDDAEVVCSPIFDHTNNSVGYVGVSDTKEKILIVARIVDVHIWR